MKYFGQDLFAVNNYPTGTIYTFKFDNNYKVEVTESKKNYYTLSIFDKGKQICYDSVSWLDESSLVDKLSKIKALGVV